MEPFNSARTRSAVRDYGPRVPAAKENPDPRCFVLASCAASEDPSEVARRYRQNTEFSEDIRNLNVSKIVGVESAILMPPASSRLK